MKHNFTHLSNNLPLQLLQHPQQNLIFGSFHSKLSPSSRNFALKQKPWKPSSLNHLYHVSLATPSNPLGSFDSKYRIPASSFHNFIGTLPTWRDSFDFELPLRSTPYSLPPTAQEIKINKRIEGSGSGRGTRGEERPRVWSRRGGRRFSAERRRSLRHPLQTVAPHHHLRVSGSGVATTTPDDKGMKKSDAIEARRVYMYIYIYIEVRARRQVQSSTACRAARIVRCQPSICEFHPRGNPPSPPHRARTGGLPGHVSYLVSCSRLRGTLERKRTRPYRARTHHVIWNCEQRLTPPFLFPIFYFSNFRRRRNNFYFHIFDSVWFFFFVSGYFFLSFFSSRETMWRVSSKIDQLLEFRGWRWTTGEIGWNFKQDCADWMIKI